MKRRLWCLCLVLCMALTASSGMAEELLSKMDSTGASTYKLTEMSLEWSDLPLYVAATVVGEGNLDDAAKNDYVESANEDGLVCIGTGSLMTESGAQVWPISISPDGQTILLNTDMGLIMAMFDGKLVLQSTTSARGVEDTYGALEKLKSKYFIKDIDDVVWSPDGRYIAIVAGRQVAIKLHGYWQLLLMDVHSGEIYLAATWPTDLMKPGGKAVIAACFDATGENLYFQTYGKPEDNTRSRYTMWRYDVQAEGLTELYSTEKLSYPGLMTLDAEGRFVCPCVPNRGDEYPGLITYQPDGTSEKHPLPLTMSEMKPLFWSQSTDGEKGILRLQTGWNNEALLIVDIKDGYNGLQDIITIRRDDLPHAVRMSGEEFLAIEEDAYERDYCNLGNATISPDGQMALLTIKEVQRGQKPRLYLLNLQTLELHAVDTTADAMYSQYAMGPNNVNGFVRGCVWYEGNRLLIGQKDQVKLYQLTEE